MDEFDEKLNNKFKEIFSEPMSKEKAVKIIAGLSLEEIERLIYIMETKAPPTLGEGAKSKAIEFYKKYLEEKSKLINS